MNTNIEELLTSGMRERVAGLALAGDVLGAARHRHRRRTVVVRGGYALGVLCLAGLVGAAVVTGGDPAPGQSPADPARSTGDPDPARLALVAAVNASDGISYRVKVTVSVTQARLSAPVDINEGAFDPARATGYLNSPYPGGAYYERLIDGVRYVSSSGSTAWKQYPGRHESLTYDRNFDGAAGASADPHQLFTKLRQAGAKITKTGPTTFHFELAAASSPASPTVYQPTSTFAGEVTVNADNRIARIEYEQTVTGGKSPGAASQRPAVHLVTVELSDYGMPVNVDRPTNVVVVK